jgi:hypothetical protein
MFPPSAWIWDFRRAEFIRSKVEGVSDNELRSFTPAEVADVNKVFSWHGIGWKNQGLLMGNPVDETERRRHNIHFPVTDHEVAVTSEALDILVLVDILVVRIQEITVT